MRRTRCSGTAKAKEALSAPLVQWSGWQKQLEEGPSEFVAACTERVEEWTTQMKTREDADKNLGELKPGVGAAQAQAGERIPAPLPHVDGSTPARQERIQARFIRLGVDTINPPGNETDSRNCATTQGGVGK